MTLELRKFALVNVRNLDFPNDLHAEEACRFMYLCLIGADMLNDVLLVEIIIIIHA